MSPVFLYFFWKVWYNRPCEWLDGFLIFEAGFARLKSLISLKVCCPGDSRSFRPCTGLQRLSRSNTGNDACQPDKDIFP